MHLIDEIRAHGIDDPYWTFGGGTVLMLRYRHRRSKDIDIFVPDPQYLGYVSPRLSEVAEAISADYVEGAGFVKLIRPEGETDFVASPNLTATPFETWSLQRRSVRVETAAEIVAKKLWHRGDQVSARDLFDLSLAIEREPESLRTAGRFLVRHREAFIEQLSTRAAVLKAQFDAIDVLKYRPTFEDAAVRAERFLKGLPPEVEKTTLAEALKRYEREISVGNRPKPEHYDSASMLGHLAPRSHQAAAKSPSPQFANL